MGFFSRHRKAFRSVIASFGMLFGLLAGVSVTANVGYAGLNSSLSQLLELSEKGKGTWQTNNDSIRGEVTGNRILGIDSKHDATFYLKNISGKAIELTFDWSAVIPSSKGTVTVGGKTYTTSQNSVVEKIGRLEANQDVSIKLEATGKNTTKIQVSKITAVVIVESSVTFKKANFGHYYVNDILVDDGFQQLGKQLSTTTYRLNAKADDGYEFFGWQTTIGNISKIVSIDNPYEFKSAEDCEVTAIFKKGQNLAIFSNDSRYFGDLNEAISHAKAENNSDKTIVAVKDGTVASGNYTLDGNVHLLIPHNSFNVFETTEPEFIPQTSASEANVEFRRLTLKSGTLINVADGSSISVGSKMYCTGAQYSSYPIGGYGRLELEAGAKVILNSGSNFYCWGFATGDGEIEAKSGANVYEMFQIGGYRGGGATKKIKEENSMHVFPFNQYFVQNIEAKLIINYGAKEIVTVGIYTNGFVGLGAGEYHSSFCFIGYDNDGMFSLGRGYIAKKYLPMQDRLQIEIHGDGAIRSINFKLGVDFDSSKYVLPIMHNIDIDLAEGDFTVGIEQDVGLLPGSTIKVGKGSKYVIKNNRSVYLYGKDDWKAGYASNGVTMAPVYYSPTTGSKPKIRKNVVDALFDVNGTVEVQSGCGLYSCVTGNPAPFISSKRTGNVLFASEQAAEIVDQYTHQAEKNEGSGLSVTVTYGNIPINRIQFRNGDLSITSDALPANSNVVYDKVLDRWSVSTAHAKKFGLFKTLDGNTIQTVLLHNDIKQSNYTGLFYYSKKTSASYNAADERYYYLNKGVVSKRNEWWKDSTNGAYYHFGPNQYAYQNVSVVLSPTASGDNPARGIKARYFFDPNAKLLRMVSVDSITSNFSSGMTITSGICYYNGIKAGFGLFENQSHVYLAKDDGSLMTNGTYYVPSHKINNIKDSSGKVLTAGLYYFDKNGHMYDSNFKEITRGTAS